MHQDILSFWFEEIDPKMWWVKDLEFDSLISQRFMSLLQQAIKAELYDWRISAKGRLAEIIVLDQFSRNIHRDTAQAFSQDPIALVLAQEAVSLDLHLALSESERGFLFLPYMHSESVKIHAIGESLYEKYATPENHRFELRHKEIIDRFGRYPHRNKILGRASTQEEIELLKQPGSSF